MLLTIFFCGSSVWRLLCRSTCARANSECDLALKSFAPLVDKEDMIRIGNAKDCRNERLRISGVGKNIMTTSSKASVGKPTRARSSTGSVTWAQAVRDIVVAAINRGQLPVLGLLALLLLLIWKMPPDQAGAFLVEMWRDLRAAQMLAYFLLAGSVGGWYFHSKSQRKWFSEEMDRIGKEKSDLQSTISGTKFKSSNRK